MPCETCKCSDHEIAELNSLKDDLHKILDDVYEAKIKEFLAKNQIDETSEKYEAVMQHASSVLIEQVTTMYYIHDIPLSEAVYDLALSYEVLKEAMETEEAAAVEAELNSAPDASKSEN